MLKRKPIEDLHVVADTRDNSITLSADLCKEIGVSHDAKTSVRIFVFRIADTGEYAFKRVPARFAEQAECAVVSFNPALQSFGFVALVPSVNMMFYTMGIEEAESRLRVEKRTIGDGSIIYVLIAP